MKVVITGGHFSPAYSVINKLKKDCEIVVIGRKYAFEGEKNETLEYRLCKKEDIPFFPINAGRLQRNITTKTVPSLLRFPKGIYDAIKILKKERPGVVLTFGGYVGLTVSLAAKILSIPVVLHEQTQKAGLSSKVISKFASVVCISFDSSRKYFKNKNIVLTGNPIREEIFNYKDLKIKKDKPIIYITGGSTGSHFINQLVFKTLEDLLEDYVIIHQTGNSRQYQDFEKLNLKKKSLDDNVKNDYILQEFFVPEEVGWLLNNASLVVSRAGANTITELLVVGAVSFLVPLPHGQSNEQLENAIFFKKSGLGQYLKQDELTPQLFIEKVSDMIKNRNYYLENKKAASELVHKDAAERIIEQVFLYGGARGFSNTKVIH